MINLFISLTQKHNYYCSAHLPSYRTWSGLRKKLLIILPSLHNYGMAQIYPTTMSLQDSFCAIYQQYSIQKLNVAKQSDSKCISK